jgi:hypothetical protein
VSSVPYGDAFIRLTMPLPNGRTQSIWLDVKCIEGIAGSETNIDSVVHMKSGVYHRVSEHSDYIFRKMNEAWQVLHGGL